MSDESEVLHVGGREIAISNPAKVLFPKAGHTKLDLVRYYLAVAHGRAAADRAAGRTCSSATRTASTASSSTRSGRRSRGRRGSRSSRCVFRRAGAPRKSCRAMPRRSPGWRTSPASSCTRIRCAPRISTIRTSCASTSIRSPASRGSRSASVAREVRRDARRSRAARLAEDVRLARPARLRADRAGAGRSPRCAAPRWRSRARSSGARPPSRRASGGRRSATASFSTTTRTRRTGRCAGAYSVRPTPDARVSAPLSWDEVADLRSGRLHAGDDAAAVRGSRRRARRHGRARVFARRPARARRHGTSAKGSATRRGRRTTASRPAKPPRVAPSRQRPTPKHPLIESPAPKKADALARLERWKARHPEVAAHLEPADVLVDAMRGRFHRRGPASASTCSTCRRPCVRHRNRSNPIPPSPAGLPTPARRAARASTRSRRRTSVRLQAPPCPPSAD